MGASWVTMGSLPGESSRMSSKESSMADAGMEGAVLQRYAKAAAARQEALCCPTRHEPGYLEALPPEILERDYGCGNPSVFAREGDAVLDLGSGTGKLAYILSQVVGPQGRVLGVDFNEEMLALARRHLQSVGDRIGWHNVRFLKGRIQDLGLDLDALDAWLARHPETRTQRQEEERLRRENPLIADASVDLIVSSCVLNLVRSQDKRKLFAEMFRVLHDGGRIAISDIVSDQEVPDHMQNNPELWTGCISGAFQEQAFLHAFEDAGFHAVTLAERAQDPFAVEEGIEFHAVTVTAHKGDRSPDFDEHCG